MNKFFYIFTFTVLFSLASSAQDKTIVAGSSDAPLKVMRFYPNPAASVINFEFQKAFDKSYTFQIFNFIGKKVVDLKTASPKFNIPLTDFYRGIYIYQLRDKSGKIIDSGKFQVVK